MLLLFCMIIATLAEDEPCYYLITTTAANIYGDNRITYTGVCSTVETTHQYYKKVDGKYTIGKDEANLYPGVGVGGDGAYHATMYIYPMDDPIELYIYDNSNDPDLFGKELGYYYFLLQPDGEKFENLDKNVSFHVQAFQGKQTGLKIYSGVDGYKVPINIIYEPFLSNGLITNKGIFFASNEYKADDPNRNVAQHNKFNLIYNAPPTGETFSFSKYTSSIFCYDSDEGDCAIESIEFPEPLDFSTATKTNLQNNKYQSKPVFKEYYKTQGKYYTLFIQGTEVYIKNYDKQDSETSKNIDGCLMNTLLALLLAVFFMF
ncbi:hypothetical protein EIN_162150 [Entamoeba invadens IP1]|uniref:Uncharacterized protein n=1 Tax=Entamoeba invadens IP1 TaxID=370355 RepID=A0A0A1TYI6_ENTIV|nr:hypothetical protein EIN_162150 [Entamoeba invadens IP1]ELP86581.1 hypothetical protein EIN_162150 [Entamoeba invadens IP1]|eukprot:XP_004185927.1 hypothetical protein EIN_162150 [Entamoeba invadens IP1]